MIAAMLWIRRCAVAYWRDFTGKNDPTPLPQRVRKIACPPPHNPDGPPLDEWERRRWSRILCNYNRETAEPRRPR
jgi:hypothetical protein